MKKRKNIVPIIILLLIVLILISVMGIWAINSALSARIDGEYIRQIDLSDECAESAYDFLSSIENVDFSYEEIHNSYEDICIGEHIRFMPERLSLGEGTYIEFIPEEDYNAKRDEFYSILSGYIKNAVDERLIMEGYSYSQDESAALTDDALGMELEEFLKENFSDLFVSYESLTEAFPSDRMSYVCNKGMIQFGGLDHPAEYTVLKNKDLIITGIDDESARIYQKVNNNTLFDISDSSVN